MFTRTGIVASLFVLAIALGCSSDEVAAPNANVSIVCRIDNAPVNSVGRKGSQTAGDVADSITVTRVRVLVKRMILHPSNSSDSANDRSVKAGPFVFLADSTGTRLVASVYITPGSYDKLKYEIHRFSSSEISAYQNDPQFADFVSTDRYSVIIDGNVVRDGTRQGFQYRSDITANVEIPLGTFTVPGAGSTTATIEFSSARAFSEKGQLVDPRDPKNESVIDNNLKAAFRLNP